MPPTDLLPEKLKSAVKDISDSILVIYGEKGIEPFKRPLMMALPVLLGLYALVYSPLSEKLKRSVGEARSMTVVAQYAGDYENAKTKLAAYQRRLPLLKDKDDWLNYLITTTARNSGVSVDSLGAQRETEVGNYMLVSREVTATTAYGVFGNWLAEIENSPIFLRVTEMNLRRDENALGMVKVTFTLSTVFPRQGGGAK
ncbi:MAG: type 4a pilus biogenesis protein PilO [Elusimicrobiota bacterium]|nr:type 4a pilus biogenesis protein PilO [Elusimicrobiota bacterium]